MHRLTSVHGAVIFAFGLVKYHSGPFSAGKLYLADVLDIARLGALHPNSVADDKRVGIICEGTTYHRVSGTCQTNKCT